MTYFKIATNIHRNINEKDIKLKLEKTPNIKRTMIIMDKNNSGNIYISVCI